MWLLGLIIGTVIGGSIGGGVGLLPGAVLGAVFGLFIDSKRGEDTKDLSRRLRALELEVAELKERLAAPTTPIAATSVELAPSSSDVESSIAQEAALAASMTAVDMEEKAIPSMSATPLEPEQPQKSAPEFPSPSPASIKAPSQLWHWLFGGNILAKLGVVLLFFAVDRRSS